MSGRTKHLSGAVIRERSAPGPGPALWSPAASAPHRVVSFISVAGCGTLASSGIRQNRRQLIESLTSAHKLS